MRTKTATGSRLGAGFLALVIALGPAPVAFAQAPSTPSATPSPSGTVQLDFDDVELAVVIDTIARLTGRNFIYDDRVRGRVTIVSPTKITVEEAYAVFESVLQVKGFTTVQGPGGAVKVIPIREAKESNVETGRGTGPPPDSDRFVTRLIPLRYIDADAITNTLKPLVSKDASMVAYAPTNTVILTDSGTNISRILAILRSIDVETYKEELTVIDVRYADATTMAQQLSEIFDAEVSSTRGGAAAAAAARARRPGQPAAGPQIGAAAAGRVRIITDERTNSLIVMASRQRQKELRDVVKQLDVPVTGGGRIHVYYLRHADSEELADTLNGLISGQPSSGQGQPGSPTNVQALRAAITELSEGVTVAADAPTNSLVIQASQEGFNTLSHVIDQLDIERPQVLVEALIMEVDVTDALTLGFSGIARIMSGDNRFLIGSIPGGLGGFDGVGEGEDGGEIGEEALEAVLSGLTSTTGVFGLSLEVGETLIQALMRVSGSEDSTNILSAPHILTLDNEEAEIVVGDNIPIVTSRVESATGATEAGLSTSANIERQDIGITLRVTPQISEGDSLRLDIFQEISQINAALTEAAGFDTNATGPALSNRTVENTVVVADSETIVIGGLIAEVSQTDIDKVPWLGDIPVLGWLFKSSRDTIEKRNLLIFLTPHIVRNEAELAYETIIKREEFWESSEASMRLTDREKREAQRRREAAEAAGIPLTTYEGKNAVRSRLIGHRDRYPVERMREIEETCDIDRTTGVFTCEPASPPASASSRSSSGGGTRYSVMAATFGDEGAAAATLRELIDAGYDGALFTEDRSGMVLYEIRLGPYESLEKAEDVSRLVGTVFGLDPSVVIDREGAR